MTARRLVGGLYAGRHGSPQRGVGIDFHDYRSYCPGDAVSQVDWKLFGRTNRYYVRRHRRLSDLQVYVMVDRTASMQFAAAARPPANRAEALRTTKLMFAKTLAAAVAMVTVDQHDRVGLGVFSSRIDHHTPPGRTRDHLLRVCSTLEDVQPATGRGDVGRALREAQAILPRRGVIVLISDLLDEPGSLLEGLSRLRHDRFEVILFQVVTGQELDLNGLENQRLTFVDPESGRSVTTDVSDVSARYRRLVDGHLTAVRRACRTLGVDHSLVTTDQPPFGALARYLRRRAGV